MRAASKLATFFISGMLVAQDGMAAPSNSGSGVESADCFRTKARCLIEEVVDPTAYLLRLRLQYQWVPDAWNEDGSVQAFTFRPTLPYTVWGVHQILRLTLPYVTENLQGTHGMGDTQALDLAVFDLSWTRWGAGVSENNVPLGKGDTFQIGPAIAFIARPGAWTLGFLSQSFFSEHVARSLLQPIVAFAPTSWLSLNLGNDEIVYNWDTSAIETLPLGVETDVIFRLWGRYFHLYANALYNLRDSHGTYRWQFIIGGGLPRVGEDRPN